MCNKCTSVGAQVGNRLRLDKKQNNTKKMIKNRKKPNKTEKDAASRINLHITDTLTLELIERLIANEKFPSKTAVINEALRVGLPFLCETELAETSGNRVPPLNSANDLEKDIRGIKIVVDQISAGQSLAEKMLVFLYNLQIATADGVEITPELIQTGAFSQLPDDLNEAKNDIIRADYLKRRKK